MELRQLRYFVVLARELHFSRAAGQLHIAQPALSQQVRNLERELGVMLLQRTRRNVQLTDAGRAFVEEARRTLAQAERTADAARLAHRGELGQLLLGFEGAVAYDLLPRILAVYRSRFPAVRLVLREMGTAEQIQALGSGRIDAGFLSPIARDDALLFETVSREPYIAVLPAAHPLADQPQILLAALAAEPFVLFPRHEGVIAYDQIISMCLSAGFSPLVVQEAVRYVTLTALVGVGVGVTVAPACVARLRRADVVYRPLAEPTPLLERMVAWRRGNRSEVLAAFLEVARVVHAADQEGVDAGRAIAWSGEGVG